MFDAKTTIIECCYTQKLERNLNDKDCKDFFFIKQRRNEEKPMGDPEKAIVHLL
jgi:hypothetical protein